MSQTISNQPLIINEDDRYSRLRLIGWWDQEKIANANVMVVGAGALGNEVLKNLALLGFGQIHLIDFDTVQDSNLCLLYTSPSPRDLSTSRMPSSA